MYRIRPQLLCTVVTCVMTSVTALSLVYIAAGNAELARRDAQIPIYSQSAGEPQYTIREHGGKVAVFKDGAEEPEVVFNVYIKTLPEYDQKQLQAGVKVVGEQVLMKRIEDYIS